MLRHYSARHCPTSKLIACLPPPRAMPPNPKIYLKASFVKHEDTSLPHHAIANSHDYPVCPISFGSESYFMLSLKQNTLYQSTYQSFTQSNFEESIQTVQGFILGLLAQGFDSADRKILKLTQDILNDGITLSGKGVAVFTTLLLELERELKDNKIQLFLPQKDDQVKPQERLRALGAIAYGALLGLTIPQQALPFNVIADPEQSKAMRTRGKITPKEHEQLETLEQIAKVDPNSDLDEEDYDLIATEIGAIITEIYTNHHLHN